MKRGETSCACPAVASLHAMDLAPVTAALCLLARALVTDNSVRQLHLNLADFRLSLARAVPPEVAAAREARLIGRVLSELNRTVELSTSLKCARQVCALPVITMPGVDAGSKSKHCLEDLLDCCIGNFCRTLAILVADEEPYAQVWAAIEATAVTAGPRRRMAVAMALHPR